MTIDEFRRRHPGCAVGRPSPTFPLLMSFFCVGVVLFMLRYLISWRLADVDHPDDILAPIGGIFLGFSFSVGSWITAQRLVQVLGWMRRGHCSFAAGGAEALLVGEKGESVLIPLEKVVALDLDIHTITLKMAPDFLEAKELSSLISAVLLPGGDGPGGRAFFAAVAPLVKEHAPAAKVSRKDPGSLF